MLSVGHLDIQSEQTTPGLAHTFAHWLIGGSANMACGAPDCTTALKGRYLIRTSPCEDTFLNHFSVLERETNTENDCSSVQRTIASVMLTNTSSSLHGGLMRQPTRVVFHCAKIIYGSQTNPYGPRTVDLGSSPRRKRPFGINWGPVLKIQSIKTRDALPVGLRVARRDEPQHPSEC